MNPDAILFGAFERHNFGDLLMGFAFEKLLRQKGIRTIHASILENDLTAWGGTRVHSIFRLLASGLDTSIPILHVGGETASCSFREALACDSPAPLPFHLSDVVSSDVHQHLGTDRPFPYLTPSEERVGTELKRWETRLFYGIGLTRLADDSAHNERLKASLTAARMIGFRDANSLSNARNLAIGRATFAPDIVLAISRLLPAANSGKPPYLLLHFNGGYLRRHAATLIQSLSQIASNFKGGLKIGLAGTANYHDSLEELYRFKRLADASSVPMEVLPEVDIFAICQQIAGAAAVVSTSLHYRIVARSYGVPRLTMNGHKVNCWSESNDGAYPFGVEPEGLAFAVNALIPSIHPIRPVDDRAQMKDLSIIDSHIETITGIIRAAAPGTERPRLKETVPPPTAPATDLWVAAMVRCLDDRERSIRAQAETIQIQDAVLRSKTRLLRRLLGLLLAAVRRHRPWRAAPASGQTQQHLRRDPEATAADGDAHHPIIRGGVVQRTGP
jgi:hypothetical protein